MSSEDLRLAVKELALSLPDGQTDGSCECPKCGKAGSFNITRDGNNIKFICFRVSCGFAGYTDSKGMDTGVQQKTKKVKLFKGELTKLLFEEIQFLERKFLIDPAWLQNVRYCEKDGRVYYPQYHVSGKLQGYIARYYPELANCKQFGPKAIWKPVRATVGGLLLPHMRILSQIHEQSRVVLVEDYPSALRINSQLKLPTCCLGGTSLYPEHIDTILGLGVDTVIPVLDADAVVKAVKMCQSVALCFNTQTIPLTGADPKDMTVRRLRSTFESLI
jgi:Zn ribbon nucleic-acid-binding protein